MPSVSEEEIKETLTAIKRILVIAGKIKRTVPFNFKRTGGLLLLSALLHGILAFVSNYL